MIVAQRIALVVVGERADSLSKRNQLKARTLLRNAVRTHRQLHAVFGGVWARRVEQPG